MGCSPWSSTPRLPLTTCSCHPGTRAAFLPQPRPLLAERQPTLWVCLKSMKCENVCGCAHSELEKMIQAMALQATPSRRHPSALPKYATLPSGSNSDWPDIRLEQINLLKHSSFLGGVSEEPQVPRVCRSTEISICMSRLLSVSDLASPPSWVYPKWFGCSSWGKGQAEFPPEPLMTQPLHYQVRPQTFHDQG